MDGILSIDMKKFAPIFAIIGAVLFVLGFLMRGGTKKSTGVGVISMVLRTIGIVLLLIAISYWVTTSFSEWNKYSDKML